MLHRSILLALVVLLATAGAAAAAPPPTGERPPQRHVPSPIEDGFFGPVFVGPRSYCGPIDGGGGLCVDVLRSGCQLWRRAADGTWLRGRVLWDDSSEAFWTGPYSRGYQWIWGLRSGYGVVATKCLFHFEPLHT